MFVKLTGGGSQEAVHKMGWFSFLHVRWWFTEGCSRREVALLWGGCTGGVFPEGEWFTGSSLKGRFVRTHGRRWLLRWGGSLVFTIGGGDYRGMVHQGRDLGSRKEVVR